MDANVIATTWRLIIVCLTVLFCWLAYWEYRKKRLQFEERRTAIENGMEPPPLPPPALGGWPGVKQQELQLKYAERRLRIEKGLDVPVDVESKPWTRRDYLRHGLVGASVGVGLALAYAGLALVNVEGSAEAQAWAIGLAPLVFLYGVANLIYQRYVPETPLASDRAVERTNT